ncbi:MAG TPA: formylglycine-generating enzyme family protein [Pseudomonadales bacterium]|nr:formylglycine-generating enzyme family protein [Pseudomonadales bacterium]
MKRRLVCLLLVGGVGCGVSDPAKQTASNEVAGQVKQVDPNQEANKLFVEAMQLIESSESKSNIGLDDEGYNDYEKAVSKVLIIVDDYPGSDLAVKLISGATLFTGKTLFELKNSLPHDMTFKLIPAGTFMMGSPETETDSEVDEDQHQVTITKAFYMQTTEVTQGQWKAVMGTDPWKNRHSYFNDGPNIPAVYVKWDDAVAYCEKLSAKVGKTYRLPTEAEWEYACRAGTKTAWSFGNDGRVLGDYAWYDGNERERRSITGYQVGLKKPNAFGLYDMHGNVWEWCNDYYGRDYYKQSPEKDPQGPPTGSRRVLRGGSHADRPFESHSDFRAAHTADDGGFQVGFRLVRELD